MQRIYAFSFIIENLNNNNKKCVRWCRMDRGKIEKRRRPHMDGIILIAFGTFISDVRWMSLMQCNSHTLSNWMMVRIQSRIRHGKMSENLMWTEIGHWHISTDAPSHSKKLDFEGEMYKRFSRSFAKF